LPSCAQDCQRARAFQAGASSSRPSRLQAHVIYNLDNVCSHLEGVMLGMGLFTAAE